MKTLSHLIQSLARYKDEEAIIYRTGIRRFTYSYKDVVAHAKKVGKLLQKYHVKKGDRIILWGPNSPEWVFVALGAVLNGVILVPIDVHNTAEFAKNVVKKTQPKLIFSVKFKPSLGKKTVYFEDLVYDLGEQQKKFPKITPNDIVEIVFTSGTTGKPKGVVLKHKNLVANLKQVRKRFGIEQASFLSLLPLSHMFEQTINMWFPLMTGGKITYLKSLHPTDLFNSIKEESFHYILLVPRILEMLLNNIKRDFPLFSIAKRFPFLFKPVRHIFGSQFKAFVSGGAPLDPELAQAFRNMGFTVWQGYGLTETSPILTVATEPGGVGKALDGVQIKIKNKEILVKGENVFSGYYKDKQKTKQAFSKGWFKTGDVGALKNGILYIKSRKKDVIVTSAGMNVYPEDIEHVLNKMVKDSCVLEHNGIHAVFLMKKGKAQQMVDKANEQLADYQKITGYTIWPELDFPRTTTLKIRKNFVKEYLETTQVKKHKASQITEQSQLRGIIQSITKKKVKPSSTLDRLGLSSLDRVELAALIEQNFHKEVDESAITGKTTVKQLQQIIDKGIREGHIPYPKWPINPLVKVVRAVLQHIFFFRLLRYYCDIKIEGNIPKEQVIFVPNHASHFDGPSVLYALPFFVRHNTVVAAWAEYFFYTGNIFKKILRRFLYYFLVLGFNLYPFPQTKGFRRSLAHTGYLVDQGNNILIFPEGERSRTGKLLPFKQGIGIIAKECRLPIVPVKIIGAYELWSRGRKGIKKGTVTVRFGTPLRFTKESSVEITNLAFRALKKL